MNPLFIFLLVFFLLLILVIFLQWKYELMLDASMAYPKPYSFARAQMVWWTFIVLSVFISIVITSGKMPTLNTSTLVLLGLGALTMGIARLIDISDRQKLIADNNVRGKSPALLSVDQPSQGFMLDILSDNSGVSIHRLQAVMFNLVFGIWFIYKSFLTLKGINTLSLQSVVNSVMPVISDNNLILLSLSAGTYVALKTTENK